MPVARSTASGNLAGCAVASATSGVVARTRARAAGREPDGRVGIEQRAAPARTRRASPRASRRRRTRRPRRARAAPRAAAASSVSEPGLREAGELARGALGIASVELEEQPLEVRGDLDVHARAERGHDVARLHAAAREQARQDVVGVRADHEPLERQPEARATQPESTLPKLPVGTAKARPRPPSAAVAQT